MQKNLIIRASNCDAISTHTAIPIQKINTAERDIKRQRMVRVTNMPGGNYILRLNHEPWLILRYIHELGHVVWVPCCFYDSEEARRGETKFSMSKCGKKVAHVTNRGSSFDNTLSIIVKLPSNNINKKDYNDYVLQAILPLYTNTIKDSLFHLGGGYCWFYKY